MSGVYRGETRTFILLRQASNVPFPIFDLGVAGFEILGCISCKTRAAFVVILALACLNLRALLYWVRVQKWWMKMISPSGWWQSNENIVTTSAEQIAELRSMPQVLTDSPESRLMYISYHIFGLCRRDF